MPMRPLARLQSWLRATFRRRDFEHRMQQEMQVHLELWVKVEPRWTKRPARIKALGYV